MNLPSGTVTFLFTDIEGSSRLWERNAEAMERTLARHDELLRELVRRHGGHVFKTVGDEICAAFTTAPDAAAAAADAQRALDREEWTETGPLRVRMALHSGTAQERDGDYFGTTPNRVARLLDAAHGGQVLVSRATVELARDHLPGGTALHDLGEHRLKDLIRPERTFQLLIDGLPAQFPPLRSLDSHPNNIPVQLTPLLGRQGETQQARELLLRDDVRLLTLTGPGGTGKTRLALQTAAELSAAFEDGVYFVALAAVREPEILPSVIGQTLGVRESADQPALETLRGHLRHRRMLLVLDNFEQLTAAAPVVSDLLTTCPGVKALVTSRGSLHLNGEHELAVSPLAVPDLERLPPLEILTQYAAVELFIERATAVRPGFAVTTENAPAVAEICFRLDGLPLAIELAAARIRLLPPQAILSRLESRLRLLTGGAQDLPARHQTLRGAIDWSHELLDEREKTLFRRLAVFVDPFTLEAAEQVCAGEVGLELDVLDGVASLVDKSLVRQEENLRGEARCTMLQTIREYALDLLVGAGEAEGLRRRHAGWCLALAEAAEPELDGPHEEWPDRLQAHLDDLREALTFTLEAGDEPGLRLAAAMWQFWERRGYLREGRGWMERALAQSSGGAPLLRARVLLGAATLALLLGDFGLAKGRLEESLKLFRSQGDAAGVARVLEGLGRVTVNQGDCAAGSALYQESLAAWRALGDRRGIARALTWLGSVAWNANDLPRARAWFEESGALRAACGDIRGVARTHCEMGLVLSTDDDYGGARSHFEEGLRLSREAKDDAGTARALWGLGKLAIAVGDYGGAETALAEGLLAARRCGDQTEGTWCATYLAQAAAARGEYPLAYARLDESARSLREEGDRWRLTYVFDREGRDRPRRR